MGSACPSLALRLGQSINLARAEYYGDVPVKSKGDDDNPDDDTSLPADARPVTKRVLTVTGECENDDNPDDDAALPAIASPVTKRVLTVMVSFVRSRHM